MARRAIDRAEVRVREVEVAGQSVRVRDEVHQRWLRGPRPGPNAPLLIRLVRHPFALYPVPPGRRANTARPVFREIAAELDAPRPDAREALRAARLDLPGRPTDRALPEPPPRPFCRRRGDDDLDTVTVGVAP